MIDFKMMSCWLPYLLSLVADEDIEVIELNWFMNYTENNDYAEQILFEKAR